MAVIRRVREWEGKCERGWDGWKRKVALSWERKWE